MTENDAMDRALDLAVRGWGRVSPNPLVGAVLLRDGERIGEGYHAEYGGPHAEVAALSACDDARGATCVVTLEPCAHRGKTAPCTEALLGAGVTRVVLAMRDPHSTARGGVEVLRDAGVDVQIGPGSEAAAALNARFLWNVVRPELPFVAVKFATSLDGFLADADGRSQWLSGEAAREFVHWLRAGFAALAVGRRTAVMDDPQLTVRGPITPRESPARIVFARSGELPPTLRIFTTPGEASTVVVRVGIGVGTDTWGGTEGTTRLGAATLREALIGLKARGIDSVLVEGGGTLARALLADDLVDRLYWVQAPLWLGRGIPAFGPRGPVRLDQAPRWVVTDRRPIEGDTLLVVDRRLCLQES